jgi:hypothetical protein
VVSRSQAESKFIKAQQSQPKLSPNISKKKAWISFDSLVGFEPFQWVIASPWAKKYLLFLHAPASERIATEILLLRVFAWIAHDQAIIAWVPLVRKEMSTFLICRSRAPSPRRKAG